MAFVAFIAVLSRRIEGLGRGCLAWGLGAALLMPAGLGCNDTACLRWTAEMQAADAQDAGADAGTDAGAALACPSPQRAAELLGDPSCAEEIASVDGNGKLDTDAQECCYDVTLRSRSCEANR